MFDNLLMGFQISLSPSNVLYCLVGTILGTVVGVLPGLGPAATIAFLLPLTFKMNVTSAIIMLAGIYYGVAYGGTLTSVLVNIPGEACTVVTCIDGYQMAKKGRAGPALGIAAFGSFIGSTFSIIGIMLLAPPLASMALSFGAPEYTSLMVASMTLVTYLSSKSVIKSLAMAVLGLILGCIGLDPITGTERFTFGALVLMDGINIAPLAMGLFGMAEILEIAEGTVKQESLVQQSMKIRNLLPNKQDWKDSIGPIIRGTPLGFFLGILPGGGAVMSSFISYGLEKRISKHPEKFGTGTIEGVAGPETANNSGTAGAFIPLLTLGLPFNVITALLLAAFMVHGVTPGPMIMHKSPDIFWGVVTSMYIGNAMLLILNLPLIGIFVNILRIPYAVLSPIIAVVCFIGAFSLSNNPMDVVVMVFFGLVGYLMRKFDYDAAPLLLAYVLGPMLERSLRQSLILSNGSLAIFFRRPVSVVLLSIALLSLMSPLVRSGYRYLRGVPTQGTSI
jgi:putative tricarboxylic transport membrane protein